MSQKGKIRSISVEGKGAKQLKHKICQRAMFQMEDHVSVVASCLYEVILAGKALAR